MATKALTGSADFTYTASTGGGVVTHTLATPLLISPQEQFASRRRPRLFQAWNEDGTVREVFTIGTPVDEIDGRIRFENEPAKLRTMLKEGLENDVTLTYRPNGSTGSTYPCKLVSVAGGDRVELTPDRGRYALGEYETTVRLRRVDGNDFEGLL